MSDDQLSRIASELEGARARLHRLVDGLSPQGWASRPAPGAWSVAQCVDHLNLTSRAFVPRLREALARAGSQPAGRPYRRDFAGRFVAAVVGPLLRMGRFRLVPIKTTPPFRPADVPPRDEAMGDFDTLQQQLQAIVRDSQGRAIDRVKISSPFAERLFYTAYAALIVVLRHQFRHIEQAEESARVVTATERQGGGTPA